MARRRVVLPILFVLNMAFMTSRPTLAVEEYSGSVVGECGIFNGAAYNVKASLTSPSWHTTDVQYVFSPSPVDATWIDAPNGKTRYFFVPSDLYTVMVLDNTTDHVEQGTYSIIASSCDCNNNGVVDTVDISTQSSRDENVNDVPDECEIGTVYRTFHSGAALGGQILLTIQGWIYAAACPVVVLTNVGDTGATVAANVAASINADSCLASQNITATASGATVSIQGLTLAPSDVTVTSTDLGLQPAIPIPALSSTSAALFALTLATLSLLWLIRQRG